MRRSPKPILIFFLLSFFASFVFAQETEQPDSAAPKRPLSYLRVRIMAFDIETPVSISLKSAAPDAPKILDEYVPIQPSTTPYEGTASKGDALEISIGGKTNTLNLDLLPDTFYTLLLYQNGSNLEQRLLQDSFPPGSLSRPPLRIFNFGSNRSAQIKVGDFAPITSPPGTFQEIELDASGILPMQVIVPDPAGGYPALSSGEILFTQGKSTSIVIIPDYRGKFRPRVWQDAVLE